MGRRRRGVVLLLVLTAVVLAGCSSTLDPRSGQQLIRGVVARYKIGRVDSVSCPSGLPATVGTAFDCHVEISPASGKRVSGTITVHIVKGPRVAILGPEDFSAPLQPVLRTASP
jgi:hypothetical protein